MWTRLTVVGAASTLCLSVGLAGAATPAGTPEVPAEAAEESFGPGPAQPTWRGPAGGRAQAEKGRVERMAQVLQLTEEQKTAFEEIVEQRSSERAALRQRLRERGRKLAETLDAANPVPATVGTLMIEQRELARKLDAVRDQDGQALRALLTTEQQAAFDSLPKPGTRPRGGRGGGPPRPGVGPMGRSCVPPDPMPAPPGTEPPDRDQP